MSAMDVSGDVCTWCEEHTATHHGYDQHNGAWHLCEECYEGSDVAR